MSEQHYFSTEKQAEMLQSAEISKKFRRKHKKREPGRFSIAPVLLLEDYSVTLICSTRECFFRLFNINAVKITCMKIKNTK